MAKDVKHVWTSDHDDLIWKRYKEGRTHSVIAEEIGGVTRSAIAGRIQRLRIARENYVPQSRGRLNQPRATVGSGRVPSLPAIPKPRSFERFTPKVDFGMITVGTGEPCTLVDLVGCKWPIGEVDGIKGRHLFCNGSKSANQNEPYCEVHSRIAHERHKPWDAVEDAKLMQEWRGGSGRDRLSQILHRTKASISGRARQLGLPG